MPRKKPVAGATEDKPRAAAKQKRPARPRRAAPENSIPPADVEESPFGSAGRFAGHLIDSQKNLLKAGLRALKGDTKAGSRGAWPLVTLEEVFDQRVAAALERLGVPTAAQLAQLADRVEKLTRRVEALSRKLGR